MLAPALNKLRPCFGIAGIALLTLIMAGCAQQRTPGYYATGHDTTQSDAEYQAQGRTNRAPSQIQLGFGQIPKSKKTNQAQASAPAAAETAAPNTRPLTEAKTFLGTIPCLSGSPACAATRMTVTLAPSGEWRARTVVVGAATTPEPGNTTAQQGCWDVVGTQPLRIVLQMKNQNTLANLTFVNDNLLRINTINDVKPTLDYHLTRQSDIDAVSELNNQPPLKCAS